MASPEVKEKYPIQIWNLERRDWKKLFSQEEKGVYLSYRKYYQVVLATTQHRFLSSFLDPPAWNGEHQFCRHQCPRRKYLQSHCSGVKFIILTIADCINSEKVSNARIKWRVSLVCGTAHRLSCCANQGTDPLVCRRLKRSIYLVGNSMVAVVKLLSLLWWRKLFLSKWRPRRHEIESKGYTQGYNFYCELFLVTYVSEKNRHPSPCQRPPINTDVPAQQIKCMPGMIQRERYMGFRTTMTCFMKTSNV